MNFNKFVFNLREVINSALGMAFDLNYQLKRATQKFIIEPLSIKIWEDKISLNDKSW